MENSAGTTRQDPIRILEPNFTLGYSYLNMKRGETDREQGWSRKGTE